MNKTHQKFFFKSKMFQKMDLYLQYKYFHNNILKVWRCYNNRKQFKIQLLNYNSKILCLQFLKKTKKIRN